MTEEEYSDFIEVRRNIIPYKDLQAIGAYGHRIAVPTDIFPTLSVLTAQGPDEGKLLRTDSDGKLLVNGGASASGGLSPTKIANISVINSGTDPSFIDITGCKTIYVASLGVAGYEPDIPSNPFLFVLSLDDGSFTDTASLCSVCASMGGATDVSNFTAVFGGGSDSSVYSGGMDVSFMFGGSGPSQLQINPVFSTPAKWVANATLWYSI